MNKRRSIWLSLSLVNLCLVAFFGFTLRSKILFSLPFVDFRSVESAHSHFAFAGWVGLSLMTLFVYDLLPESLSRKPIYQWLLAGVETSSLGMALLFPFIGYTVATIAFSSLYVLVVLIFVPVFIKDILSSPTNKNIKLLSSSALLSLVLSFLGTLGLTFIIVTKSGASLLYRDSIYTFLHFQYNGFFSLSVFALFFNFLLKKNIALFQNEKWFSVLLCLSIIPSLFCALLWHNQSLFYLLAIVGGLLIVISLFFYARIFRSLLKEHLFNYKISTVFWIFSSVSFILKSLLQVGTIFPDLGNAVYGDRPVIIGFLHLVFLGFITFYILSSLIESEFFTRKARVISVPLIVFAAGIIANELLLMLQGLGILFKTNNEIYKWLLWAASILLFTGAFMIAVSRLVVIKTQTKKP